MPHTLDLSKIPFIEPLRPLFFEKGIKEVEALVHLHVVESSRIFKLIKYWKIFVI